MNIAVTQRLEPSAPAELLGRLGALTVRLARTEREVRAAKMLRHEVFFAGRPGTPGFASPGFVSIDEDQFDGHCDHLLVEDASDDPLAGPKIVGTYRLLRQAAANQAGGFCSQSEYDVASLVSRHPERRFLELGRSCVLPEYRSKPTAELLWQGIWAYCRMHAIDVMFGCASFAGTLPVRHAMPLSFLWHNAQAEGDWAVNPTSRKSSSMDLVPAEAIDPRKALAAMPPLVKGYLRLGAKFSGSAVIDPLFCTTDVLVVLRAEDIPNRYLNHFGADADRFA